VLKIYNVENAIKMCEPGTSMYRAKFPPMKRIQIKVQRPKGLRKRVFVEILDRLERMLDYWTIEATVREILIWHRREAIFYLEILDQLYPRFKWTLDHMEFFYHDWKEYEFDKFMALIKFMSRHGVSFEKNLLRKFSYHQTTDWLLRYLDIKLDGSFTNWLGTQMEGEYPDQVAEQLCRLHEKNGLLPTKLLNWDPKELTSYSIYYYPLRTEFLDKLIESQERISLHKKKHGEIVEMCIAMEQLQWPSYVVLEIVDWCYIDNIMTHGQKISLIIRINEFLRPKRWRGER